MSGIQKRWGKAIVFAIVLVMAGWQVSAEEKNPASTENDVVAVVNGTSISRADFDRTLGFAKQQAARAGSKIDDAKVEEGVLDQLIGSELLYQESKKTGIKIDPKTVDDRLAEWKKRFPNDADYKQALEKMGLTENEMKADIEKGLTIEKFVVDNYVDKTNIPEKEIKAYYDNHSDLFKQPEQVQASHILIKVDPKEEESEKEAALKKIKDVQEKQKKGEDFAELAKSYSEGPSSSKGGDLGYFRRGQMVPPFEEAAFALNPGDVSDIVKTRFGYHLIKVTGKKPESTVPFDDIKERIAQYLKQEKVQKDVKELVDKLRKDAKVEILLKNNS